MHIVARGNLQRNWNALQMHSGTLTSTPDKYGPESPTWLHRQLHRAAGPTGLRPDFVPGVSECTNVQGKRHVLPVFANDSTWWQQVPATHALTVNGNSFACSTTIRLPSGYNH